MTHSAMEVRHLFVTNGSPVAIFCDVRTFCCTFLWRVVLMLYLFVTAGAPHLDQRTINRLIADMGVLMGYRLCVYSLILGRYSGGS